MDVVDVVVDCGGVKEYLRPIRKKLEYQRRGNTP
jgi:hypothetical protein